MKNNFISPKLYKKFTSQIPLCCIETAVKNNGKFLLVKRKDPPEKNQWWFPGGRIFFKESLLGAVKRILKEELGIKKFKSVKFLGVGESKFKKGYFNLPSYTINAVFLIKIDNFQANNIKLDLINHSGYKWLKNIPKRISHHLEKFLKLSSFKENL